MERLRVHVDMKGDNSLLAVLLLAAGSLLDVGGVGGDRDDPLRVLLSSGALAAVVRRLRIQRLDVFGCGVTARQESFFFF